jgi:hypothetical protein
VGRARPRRRSRQTGPDRPSPFFVFIYVFFDGDEGPPPRGLGSPSRGALVRAPPPPPPPPPLSTSSPFPPRLRWSGGGSRGRRRARLRRPRFQKMRRAARASASLIDGVVATSGPLSRARGPGLSCVLGYGRAGQESPGLSLAPGATASRSFPPLTFRAEPRSWRCGSPRRKKRTAIQKYWQYRYCA